MSDEGTAWECIARLAAEVANAPMLVGVRPNGTWFGHCAGIEVDADGPAGAVYAVVREAQRNAAQRADSAAVEAKSTEAQAAGFSDTVALIPVDVTGSSPGSDLGPCHVTGCDEPAVGGEIGEGGDLLLCAEHIGSKDGES